MANPLMNMMVDGDDRRGLSLGKFMEFAKQYKGNPQEEVMKLLEAGKMSRSEFESLKKQAQELARLIK